VNHLLRQKCVLATLVILSAAAAQTSTSLAAQVGGSAKVHVAVPTAPPGDGLKKEYLRPSTIPFPASNPYTIAKAELGKSLFFDTRLSNSGTQSCATCHNPSYSWGDGMAKGVGDGMKTLKRRSPTVLNAA
jgi:cytochrome c peroxidase